MAYSRFFLGDYDLGLLGMYVHEVGGSSNLTAVDPGLSCDGTLHHPLNARGVWELLGAGDEH